MRSNLLRLLAILFAFTLIAAACGDDDGDEGEVATQDDDQQTDDEPDTSDDEMEDEDEPEPEPTEAPIENTGDDTSGGTLIWAHEQEPPDMHLDDPNNNLTITAWIRQAMLDGLYGVDSTTSFYPELLAGEAVVTLNDDDTVNIAYTLRDGVTWSDGTPLTASDVEYTWTLIMDENYQIGDRTGYDLITSFNVVSDTEWNVDMSQFFAGFKQLFAEVYPAHALGADGNAANDNWREWTAVDGGPLPSSGPMLFDSWDRGSSMNLVRNESYHGSVSPDAKNGGLAFVDGVEIIFVPDTDAQINALKAEEAHIIMTQPQLAFGERLGTDENFTIASTAGPVFEHWGINLLNVHLAKPEVREALAYGIDKSEVMAGLYTPLFGDALLADGLGNTFWMGNQPDYVDHQAQYNGLQVDAAKASLEAAGYVLGGDGVYEHPTDGRLSLRVGTTGGNELREFQQELIQAQLAESGIEIVIDNVPGSDYFSERPFSEEALAAANSAGAEGDPNIWDLTQFAWVGGPWPGGQSGAYRSDGFGPYGFNNPDYDSRSLECDAIVDDAERAGCYNELDEYATTLNLDSESGLFMIPLTQKPSFYGYLSSVLEQNGVSPDANSAGPLANVQDYKFLAG